jgi:hypothetical protein
LRGEYRRDLARGATRQLRTDSLRLPSRLTASKSVAPPGAIDVARLSAADPLPVRAGIEKNLIE